MIIRDIILGDKEIQESLIEFCKTTIHESLTEFYRDKNPDFNLPEVKLKILSYSRFRYDQFRILTDDNWAHADINGKCVCEVGIPDAPDNFPEIYVSKYLLDEDAKDKIYEFIKTVPSKYRNKKIESIIGNP